MRNVTRFMNCENVIAFNILHLAKAAWHARSFNVCSFRLNMANVLYDSGEFIYVNLSKDTLNGGLNVMRKSFFIDENVSIAVQLQKHPNAIKELEELSINAAKDGVSIVAIEKSSGTVAGASFNKIQLKSDKNDTFFDNFAAKCEEPSSKMLVTFMRDCDAEFDLFTHCKVDCLMELMFLSVLREYRGRGIARKLCEVSIDFAKQIFAGTCSKVSTTGEQLPTEPVPKLVSATFTSFITQKIGESLGFQKAAKIGFDRWNFDGKTFAECVDSQTPYVTLEYVQF